MIVLSLGIAKEAVRLKEKDAMLHLIHSTLETGIACLQVVLRAIGTRMKFSQLTAFERQNEAVENAGVSVYGQALHKLITGYVVLSAFLFTLMISSYVAFLLSDHLEWTPLTNNTSLVLMTVTSGLLTVRLVKVEWRVGTDQQRAVVCELMLLLDEAERAADDPQRADNQWRKTLGRFKAARQHSEMFGHPRHITLVGARDDVSATSSAALVKINDR